MDIGIGMLVWVLVLPLVEVMVAISISVVSRASIRFGGRLFACHQQERLRLHLMDAGSCIPVQQIYPGQVITVRYVELRESEWVAEEMEESCRLDEFFGGHECECVCRCEQRGKGF